MGSGLIHSSRTQLSVLAHRLLSRMDVPGHVNSDLSEGKSIEKLSVSEFSEVRGEHVGHGPLEDGLMYIIKNIGYSALVNAVRSGRGDPWVMFPSKSRRLEGGSHLVATMSD